MTNTKVSGFERQPVHRGFPPHHPEPVLKTTVKVPRRRPFAWYGSRTWLKTIEAEMVAEMKADQDADDADDDEVVVWHLK
jgi:hypothetical protein